MERTCEEKKLCYQVCHGDASGKRKAEEGEGGGNTCTPQESG